MRVCVCDCLCVWIAFVCACMPSLPPHPCLCTHTHTSHLFFLPSPSLSPFPFHAPISLSLRGWLEHRCSSLPTSRIFLVLCRPKAFAKRCSWISSRVTIGEYRYKAMITKAPEADGRRACCSRERGGREGGRHRERDRDRDRERERERERDSSAL